MTDTHKIYEDQSALYYDLYQDGIEGDVDFYIEEAVKTGSPVLEIGCGTGRVAIPLAAAGMEVTGLDSSPDMLELAMKKIITQDEMVQQRIELIPGDMRNFFLKRKFKLIIVPYRAFQHLIDTQDQKNALKCMREHLADDGKLIIDLFDPDIRMISEHSGSIGTSMKKLMDFTDPETGNPVLLWDTRGYSQKDQIIDEYFIFEILNDRNEVIRKMYSYFKVRYFFRYEMEHLFELSGFKIEALYKDFHRSKFESGCEQIWVVSKA